MWKEPNSWDFFFPSFSPELLRTRKSAWLLWDMGLPVQESERCFWNLTPNVQQSRFFTFSLCAEHFHASATALLIKMRNSFQKHFELFGKLEDSGFFFLAFFKKVAVSKGNRWKRSVLSLFVKQTNSFPFYLESATIWSCGQRCSLKKPSKPPVRELKSRSRLSLQTIFLNFRFQKAPSILIRNQINNFISNLLVLLTAREGEWTLLLLIWSPALTTVSCCYCLFSADCSFSPKLSISSEGSCSSGVCFPSLGKCTASPT